MRRSGVRFISPAPFKSTTVAPPARRGYCLPMDRYTRWVNASYRAAFIETFIIMVVQGLGRLDIQLAAGDANFLRRPPDSPVIEDMAALTDRITTSYLWVLGGYELSRTICHRLRKDGRHSAEPYASKFKQVRESFNRLRVPLAKLEPAERWESTDSHIAYPAMQRESGDVAWHLAQDVFVTRQELADALLLALESLPPAPQ